MKVRFDARHYETVRRYADRVLDDETKMVNNRVIELNEQEFEDIKNDLSDIDFTIPEALNRGNQLTIRDLNDIEEYIELLQAMMMQESGGQGNDPMQSSECEFNTQFEKKPNAINNPEYSIQVGIQYFAKCLKQANVTSIKDEKGIFLALQSYNYGIGYIKYVEQTDKQYTYQNAIAFSQKCKKEYNVSVYGDSKYVYHVLRYYTDTSLVDDWLELYR